MCLSECCSKAQPAEGARHFITVLIAEPLMILLACKFVSFVYIHGEEDVSISQTSTHAFIEPSNTPGDGEVWTLIGGLRARYVQ